MVLKKSAHQLFTDRDEPRKAYWDALRVLEEHPRQTYVITYYGEGGIGKSWLLSELKRNTERMYEEGSIPVFDDGFSFRGEYIPVLYNLETSTDTIEILCQLRYALYQLKPDLAFPLFDCAVKKYMDLSGKKLVQPSGSSSLVLEKYGNFLDTAAMFIPGLGTLNSVYSYVKKGGSVLNAAMQKIEDKQIRELYKEYFEAISYSETVDDISDNIVEFFKTDLNNSERDYSIVFMIDTFEVLSYNTGLKDQSWITKELAKNTENTLWVFAGRNRIYPGGDENEHLLGDLSREDTLYYLREKIGITDESINERIYEISHGTPIFLDICVQNYRNEGNPSIEEYKNLDKELLLKRYIKYLSDSERLVIRLMSSMSHWNDADYKYVFNDVHNNSYSQYSEAYNNVVKSTMIEKDNEDRWFLHRAVRAGIYEDPDYPGEVKSATLTAILALYAARAKEGENANYYCDRIIELIRSLASYKEQLSDDDTKLLRDAVFEFLPELFSKGTSRIREMNALFDEYSNFLCHSELSKAHILVIKWGMLNYLGKYSDPDYTGDYSYRIYEKEYGPDDPDTLECLRRLSESHLTNGHYMEAFEYAEKLYSRCKRIFGEEDHKTLVAMGTLADACECLGRYKQALELYQRKYDLFLKMNDGKEDDQTISALQGIAQIHKDLHDYNKALEEQKRICAYYVGKFGENHPDSIMSLNDLALSYSDFGDYQTAKEMYEEAYRKSSELLGKDHPETLVHLSNIAGVYNDMGDYGKSLQLYTELYETRRTILGKDHLKTIWSLNAVGNEYQNQGHFTKARTCFKEAYELSLNRYGEDHPTTITCLANIALLDKDLELYDDAVSLYEKIYELRQRSLGEENPSTISALGQIANITRLAGDTSKALEYYEEVYEKRKRVFGEDNPDTIKTLTSIAYCYSRQGNHNEALDLDQQAYRLIVQREGKDTANALNTLFDVGRELEWLERYKESLDVMEEVYEGQVKRAGETSNAALKVLYAKSRLYKGLGDYKKALKYALDTYNLSVKSFGTDSINTCVYKSELGIAYYNVKDYEKALEVFDTLHTKLVRVYGRKNDHTLIILNWKGCTLYYLGRNKEALNALKEVFDSYIGIFGENHSRTAAIQSWINRIKKEMDT